MTFPKKPTKPPIRPLPPLNFDPLSPQPGPQRFALQQFVVTLGFRRKYPKAFASPKSLRLFKDYHNLVRMPRHQARFSEAKENQNKAIGLPLLVCKRGKRFSFGERLYFRIEKPQPRPDATYRLFKSEDSVPSGHVLRKGYFRYTRYTILVDGVESVVFAHKRLPIMDVQFQGLRFRLVKQKLRARASWMEDFAYDIYLLKPDQPSLTDNMTSSRAVGKDNPLIGGPFSYILPTPAHYRFLKNLCSDHRCGEIRYHHSWNRFTHTQKYLTLTLPTEAAASGQHHSNNNVDSRSMMFVALSFVIQNIEKELMQQRSRERAAAMTSR